MLLLPLFPLRIAEISEIASYLPIKFMIQKSSALILTRSRSSIHASAIPMAPGNGLEWAKSLCIKTALSWPQRKNLRIAATVGLISPVSIACFRVASFSSSDKADTSGIGNSINSGETDGTEISDLTSGCDLDSSTIQNEEFWANQYGTYWPEVITKGRGRFYNGNTNENKKRFEVNGLCGIGKIGRIHDDPTKDLDLEKRNILLNTIVAYMLKPDQVLLATKLCNGKHRLYGKGIGRNRIRKDKA